MTPTLRVNSFLSRLSACASHDAEVRIRMAFTNPASVFLKRHVELPVQTVLNAPAVAHRFGKAASREIPAENVAADLVRHAEMDGRRIRAVIGQNIKDSRQWRMAYVGGKRESRRLLGDVILAEQDVRNARSYPDACVTATWPLDLHYPQPDNARQYPGEEFRSVCMHVRIEPYAIPFRCLYSRNVENLFMAGRDISVTHVALGTARVQRTCGMMGEVVGMAASLCKKYDTNPRGIYENHLDNLKSLMLNGKAMK